jgi:D-arabinose 1-dehydrogenase-like Zn-dependent alcohol dehydrogenase
MFRFQVLEGGMFFFGLWVCPSNLRMIEGDWVQYGFPSETPIIPGREILCTVAKIGEDVALL